MDILKGFYFYYLFTQRLLSRSSDHIDNRILILHFTLIFVLSLMIPQQRSRDSWNNLWQITSDGLIRNGRFKLVQSSMNFWSLFNSLNLNKWFPFDFHVFFTKDRESRLRYLQEIIENIWDFMNFVAIG